MNLNPISKRVKWKQFLWVQHKFLYIYRKALNFEKYLSENGISKAFEIIFSEIISKSIPVENHFAYTATRLRQIGNQTDINNALNKLNH